MSVSATPDTTAPADDKKDILTEVKERGAQAIEDAAESAAEVRDSVASTASSVFDAARSSLDELGTSASATGRLARRRARSTLNDGRAATSQAGRSVARLVEDYPIMVGVFGLVGGFALGAAFPPTRTESRMIGDWSDQVVRHGERAVRDTVHSAERGLHAARRSVEDELGR